MSSTLRTWQLLATLLLVVAVCAAVRVDLAPHGTVAASAHTARFSNQTPGRQALAHLLWPGTFDVAPGTAGDSVGFTASGHRYSATVRSDGLFVSPKSRKAPAIDIRFVHARSGETAVMGTPRFDTLNLFSGSASLASVTHLHRFDDVRFRDAYPGISTRYRSNAGDLELDFIVQPGASPSTIALEGGADSRFSVESSSGDIIASHGETKFRLHRPRAYQAGLHGPVEVNVSAVTNGHTLRFEVSQYDSTKALTIDPLIATYSTFVGTNTDAMYDDAAALATQHLVEAKTVEMSAVRQINVESLVAG
jgi:hypothetical protein